MSVSTNIKYPNNRVKEFLFDRSESEMAEAIGVSTMAVNYFVRGVNKPHKLRMNAVLEWLGEPLGRILGEDEVWPIS